MEDSRTIRVIQHASLTAEKWQHYSLPQRLLMIATEMNRASRLLGDRLRLQNGYDTGASGSAAAAARKRLSGGGNITGARS